MHIFCTVFCCCKFTPTLLNIFPFFVALFPFGRHTSAFVLPSLVSSVLSVLKDQLGRPSLCWIGYSTSTQSSACSVVKLVNRLFCVLYRPIQRFVSKPLCIFSGRLFWVDLIKWVSNVHFSVCTSVRPSAKSFFVFSEIWHLGRGWWAIHDGMQFDPIQGQGHEPLKVRNPSIFISCLGYPPPFTMGALNWPRILKLWHNI